MRSTMLVVVLLATIPATPTNLAAACENDESQRLSRPTGVTFDAFGRVVVVSGERAVVTADGENFRGAAYAFERVQDAWVARQRIVPADEEPVDLFGKAAAIDGDRMMISNPFDDDRGIDSGSVYVFEHDGDAWKEVQKLTASDGENLDQFGWHLAFAGDVAVIGALNEDEQGANAGAAYVFRYDGAQWVEEQKLLASTPSDNDQFGFTVAAGADVVLVSAVNDDDLGFEAGAVYAFRYDGASWVEEQKILPADGAAGDFFGWALALDGDRLAIGASQHDLPFESSGALYLFDWDGLAWVESDKLAASDAVPLGNFGWSVDLEQERLVVGSIGADDTNGAIYVFQSDGTSWVESHKWLGSAAPGGGFLDDNLGMSVTLDGALVLGGAPFADGPNATDAGVAYSYDLTDLALDAKQDAVGVGEILQIEACGGLAGGAAAIQLVRRDDLPVGLLVANGRFDDAGRFRAAITIPPAAAGASLVFRAGGERQPATPGLSNETSVEILP